MIKLTGRLTAAFLFTIITTGHAMQQDPVDSNSINPKIMLKIRADALRKEMCDLQKNWKKKKFQENELPELVNRTASLFKEVSQLNKDFPGLFALCEDKVKPLEEMLKPKQENSLNLSSIDAEKISSVIKGLEASQPDIGKFDVLLKDPKFPLCCKELIAVVILMISLEVACTGSLVACAGSAAILIYAIQSFINIFIKG